MVEGDSMYWKVVDVHEVGRARGWGECVLLKLNRLARLSQLVAYRRTCSTCPQDTSLGPRFLSAAYDVEPLRISESPASRTAMVEHR